MRLEGFGQRHLKLAMFVLAVLAFAKAGPRPLFGWGPFDHGLPPPSSPVITDLGSVSSRAHEQILCLTQGMRSG